MKRKVIKQGPATLMVSLPAKWAKKYNVRAGDEIDLEEKSGSIELKAGNVSKKDRRIKIDISKMNSEMIRRFVTSAYMVGYDEIEVFFDTPTIDVQDKWKYLKEEKKSENATELIQNIVSNLVGMEIVMQRKNSLVLREIATLKSEEFDSSFRRVMLLVKMMGEELYETLKNKDNDVLMNFITREMNINMYCQFCWRLLNKKGHVDTNKTGMFYDIVLQLEAIGDRYFRIARIYQKKKIDISAEDLKFLKNINAHYGKLYESFFKFNYDNVSDYYGENFKFVKSLKDLKNYNKMEAEMMEICVAIKEIIQSVCEIILLDNEDKSLN